MIEISSNWENISVYYANLSPVYLCSSLCTIVALLLTWWLGHRSTTTNGISQEDTCPTASERTGIEDQKNEALLKLTMENFMNEQSVVKQIKSVRQSTIEAQLRAGLSEEQLSKERETQASQLAAIYKLLKEKEDQFQIKSMEELQEQLKLYRA